MAEGGFSVPSLVDRHGRRKRKLRVSLTDRCNFRCRYCMPERPLFLPKKELLDRGELVRLAGLFVDNGCEAIRVTGGEPLLRADAVECIAELNGLRARGLRRLSLTTNGSRLAPRMDALRAAGLDDLTISLDALDADRFRALRGGELAPVLGGIAAARVSGLPLKLNTVLIRDQNECEILPLTRWAMERNLQLRFIEYMPLDAPGRWTMDAVVTEAQVLDVLRSTFSVEPLPRGSEPATPYRLDGWFELGIVSTVTKPFCASCDRLRLTARGELYTCLFAETGTALAPALRSGEPAEALTGRIRAAVFNKRAGYVAAPGPVERPITMHALGG